MDPCLINILERGRRKRKLIFKRKSKSRISVYESIDFCNTICRKKKYLSILFLLIQNFFNIHHVETVHVITTMKSTIPLNLPRQYRNIFELLLHDLIESRRSCNRNSIEELFYIRVLHIWNTSRCFPEIFTGTDPVTRTRMHEHVDTYMTAKQTCTLRVSQATRIRHCRASRAIIHHLY